MAKRVRVEQKTTETKTKTTEEVEPKVPENAEDLKSELDELLDEIDSVLEENASEFVKNYIQKGGQISQIFWKNVRVGFNISIRNVVQWVYENMRSAQL